MRSRTRWLLALLLLSPACAFDDGNPWGQVTMSVSAGFDDAGRQKSDGLHTSKDYVVVLDRLDLGLIATTVNMSSDNVDLSFDPADPPEGYSLCHNGHCHADDGRLVDYADIAAELAGGVGSGQSLVQLIDVTPNLLDDKNVALGQCSDGCQLGRGFLQTVGLQVSTLVVSGRVFDTRTPSRLPAAGLPLNGQIALDTTLSSAVSGQVGRDDPAGIDVSVSLTAAAPLFDSLDFAALAGEESITLDNLSETDRALFIEKIRQELTLDVALERHDL
jgi:hypothetical protein